MDKVESKRSLPTLVVKLDIARKKRQTQENFTGCLNGINKFNDEVTHPIRCSAISGRPIAPLAPATKILMDAPPILLFLFYCFAA